MGSSSGELDAQPEHTVYLDAYYTDKYEVTNAQYLAFVRATGRAQPVFANDSNLNQPAQPVVGVTWADAKAYCEWTGLRLPTEAEWEKAARGTDRRVYPWDNRAPDGTLANFADVNSTHDVRDPSADDRYAFTAPVGSYPAGANPYGGLDFAGNVWEWVEDWFGGDYYSRSPQRNPAGPESGPGRVVRGGSWYHGTGALGAAFRTRHDPEHGTLYVGFRCARNP